MTYASPVQFAPYTLPQYSPYQFAVEPNSMGLGGLNTQLDPFTRAAQTQALPAQGFVPMEAFNSVLKMIPELVKSVVTGMVQLAKAIVSSFVGEGEKTQTTNTTASTAGQASTTTASPATGAAKSEGWLDQIIDLWNTGRGVYEKIREVMDWVGNIGSKVSGKLPGIGSLFKTGASIVSKLF